MELSSEIIKTVYCRPKTTKEWYSLMLVDINARNAIRRRYRGEIVFFQTSPVPTLSDVKESEFYKDDKTEIPVSQFIDLLEDRIAPWRLIDNGFKGRISKNHWIFYLELNDCTLRVDDEGVAMIGFGDGISIEFDGVKKYSDLINLMKLKGCC